MNRDLPDVSWVDVLSHDQFRDVVLKYKPHRLGLLRSALIEKSNAIKDQRLTPRSMKTNRDGTPMDEMQYEDWSAKAATAHNCTERQIAIVTEQMRQPHNWGNGSLCDALEVVFDMADRCANFYSVTPSEEAAMRVVRHYLDSVSPERNSV